ncbi:MAG: LptF/LptG family permease [Planctomycetota bacterium]|nr:MAG: LptF/LptG family permease [Planctomycetota bacterium]
MDDLDQPGTAVGCVFGRNAEYGPVGGDPERFRRRRQRAGQRRQDGVAGRAVVQPLADPDQVVADEIVHRRSLQSASLPRSAPRLVWARAQFREIGAQLLLVFGGTLLLVALAAMVRVSSQSQGAPLWMALALLPMVVGNAVPYLLPAALLTAVVLAYGRMAADGEATALRAAGVHPWRILGPALAIGLLAGLVSLPLSAELLPRLYSGMRELSYRLRFAALENPDPSSSELSFAGLEMSWAERLPGGVFHDVLVVYRPGEEPRAHPIDPGPGGAAGAGLPGALRLRAERCRMSVEGRRLRLRFHGLRSLEEEPSAISWGGRGSTWLTIPLDALGSRRAKDRKAADYTTGELRRMLAEGELPPRKRVAWAFEAWRRLALALAPLPLALLGAMLGWRLRRSGILTAFGVAFAVQLLVFYPLFSLGQTLTAGGLLAPAAGALLPIAGLALVLVAAAPRGRSA